MDLKRPARSLRSCQILIRDITSNKSEKKELKIPGKKMGILFGDEAHFQYKPAVKRLYSSDKRPVIKQMYSKKEPRSVFGTLQVRLDRIILAKAPYVCKPE
jgi:hypothetical protein